MDFAEINGIQAKLTTVLDIFAELMAPYGEVRLRPAIRAAFEGLGGALHRSPPRSGARAAAGGRGPGAPPRTPRRRRERGRCVLAGGIRRPPHLIPRSPPDPI